MNRERSVLERMINWLRRYRRVATRYGKLASNSLAMVTVARIMKWL